MRLSLEEYTHKIEKMMQREFCPGSGTARSLRLTLDPIIMECRTIFWYILIGLADTLTHLLLGWRFHYYKTASSTLWVLPARPATWFARRTSAAKNLSYWLRPHTAKDRLPIVYIHGIGIGLLPNIRFLAQLDESLKAATTEESKNSGTGRHSRPRDSTNFISNHNSHRRPSRVPSPKFVESSNKPASTTSSSPRIHTAPCSQRTCSTTLC